MGRSDADDLRLLDKEITDVVQSIALSLGVQNIALSQESLKKLDKLDQTSAAIKKELENKVSDNKSDGVILAVASPVSGDLSAQLDPAGPAVKLLCREFGMDLAEVRDQLAMSLEEIKSDLKINNDTVQTKLDALLDAAAKLEAAQANGGSAQVYSNQFNMSVYERALYPPEEPNDLWKDNFEMENKVANHYFVEWFQAEYMPVGDTKIPTTMSDAEKQTLILLVDAFPKDGLVSMVEFKRFCRQVAKSRMKMYDFIKSMSEVH